MDLSKRDELAEACRRAMQTIEDGGARQTWRERLVNYLEWASRSSPEQRQTVEFQKRIWNEDAVAATGQGNISVDNAIADAGFREFVAGLWEQELPEEREARTGALKALFSECMRRLEPFVRRKPRLKALRVFATAFPHDFTTIAHARRLFELYHALYGEASPSVIECNRAVLDALERALGSVGPDLTSLVKRMMLCSGQVSLAT